MKSYILKYIGSAAVALSLTLSTQATPITGGISLSGDYTVGGGNLNTATAFTSFSFVEVTSDSGSFAVAGVTKHDVTSVNMNPFTFSPFSASITPLWNTVSGVYAAFDLDPPISVLQPGDNTLTLKGYGTLHLAGYTDTPGSWTFTANQANASFSWSSSNGALPDGGMTAMLLGGALSALGLLRRKLA